MSEFVNGEARQQLARLEERQISCQGNTARRLDVVEKIQRELRDCVDDLRYRRARLDGVSTVIVAAIAAGSSLLTVLLTQVIR